MIDLIYIYTLREFTNKAYLNLYNMTFSPEDNFGSVPPTNTDEEDFDKKWDIDGLSLEGEETTPAETAGKEAEPEPTLEELGEMYRVPDKVSEAPVEDTEGVKSEAAETPIVEVEKVESSVVSNETKSPEDFLRLKKEFFNEMTRFDVMGKEYTAEAEYAFITGDMEGAKVAYQKAIEARIALYEASISALGADFDGGNFQNRGSSEDPYVRKIYESQVNTQKEGIANAKSSLERFNKNPWDRAYSEGWVGPNQERPDDNIAWHIRRLIENAESFQKKEEQGEEFYEYNSRLIGLLRGAIKSYDTLDDNTKSAIKNAVRKVKRLPADLVQQINNL